MRASLALPPFGLLGGLLLGRAAREEVPSATPPAVPIARTAEAPALPPPAPAARCSEPVADEPSPVPEGWDPIDTERRLWEDAGRFAADLAEGEVLVLDCARWPCTAVLVFPDEALPEHRETRAAFAARWPGASVRQSGWDIDGVRFDTWTLVLHDEPLTDEVQREVDLRRISLDLEVDEAAEAWAAARTP